MPAPGRAERISFLRNSIARIEAGGKADHVAWAPLGEAPLEEALLKGASSSQSPVPQKTAPPASDIHVPAPRPARFYEIAPASAGDCSAAAGFALTLAGQMRQQLHRPVLWVAEDFTLMEQGAPYVPGLAAYGIPVSDFILIRMRSRLDLWRVMEEAIKSRAFAAIIGEPAALAGQDLPALIRRLTINARAHQSCAMLLRPPAQAPFIAPSPLRFEIAAKTADSKTTDAVDSQPEASVLSRPLPAQPAWSVRYRGTPGALKGRDTERPFTARLSRRPSREALLEEVSSLLVKERSGAALSVDISRAA